MGHEINTNNNPDYSIIEEPLPEGIKSILIIRESQPKHFGSYNCTVVNEHGNDILEIELLRQGNKNICFCISLFFLFELQKNFKSSINLDF